jgi:hypothetical protein
MTTEETGLVPRADQFLAETEDWTIKARSITIIDAETYKRAGELKVGIRDLIKKIEAAHKPNIDRWKNGWEAAKADREAQTKPLSDAMAILNKGLDDYLDKEEAARKRREKEAREAEVRRQEQTRAQTAVTQLAAGNTQAAAEIFEKPVEAPVVTFQRDVPKVEGLKVSMRWSAEVFDLPALVLYLADRLRKDEAFKVELPNYLTANLVVLNRKAVDAKKEDLGIPGVKGVSKRAL